MPADIRPDCAGRSERRLFPGASAKLRAFGLPGRNQSRSLCRLMPSQLAALLQAQAQGRQHDDAHQRQGGDVDRLPAGLLLQESASAAAVAVVKYTRKSWLAWTRARSPGVYVVVNSVEPPT